MKLFCTSCLQPFDTDKVDMTCPACKLSSREESLMSQVRQLQGTVAAKDAELAKSKRIANSLGTQVNEQNDLIGRLNAELEDRKK